MTCRFIPCLLCLPLLSRHRDNNGYPDVGVMPGCGFGCWLRSSGTGKGRDNLLSTLDFYYL